MAERVLITGAAGFTGRYLARALERRGLEVHGLARAGDAAEPINGVAQVHEADLLDPEQVRHAVGAARPDYVIHLAGVSFAAHGDLAELYLSNILGTRHLLHELAEAGCVKHAILASSANVYGNQLSDALHEDLPPTPANDYGVSKAAVEQLARIFADRLPLTVTRPFNYTGVGQSTSFLIPKIVDHFRRRRPTIELGNIQVARDFSDVRDVSEIYARLLETSSAVGSTLNICSGTAVTLSDVIARCSALTGHRIEVQVNPRFVRANDVRILVGSTARLNETVGPIARIPLDQTLAWLLDN